MQKKKFLGRFEKSILLCKICWLIRLMANRLTMCQWWSVSVKGYWIASLKIIFKLSVLIWEVVENVNKRLQGFIITIFFVCFQDCQENITHDLQCSHQFVLVETRARRRTGALRALGPGAAGSADAFLGKNEAIIWFISMYRFAICRTSGHNLFT